MLQTVTANRICFRTVYTYPITFEHVVFPPSGQLKLPTLPPEPTYDENLGEEKYKTTKRFIDARGPESIHTELIHKQFGLVAINGGFIKAEDFAWIQQEVNEKLLEKQFAIWRVDAPWLPRVKRPPSTKLGGGKGSISHYETPVRSGRIILELGGYITEQEARSILMHLYLHLPFPVEFVSQELFEKRRELETKVRENNRNKFDWETIIKYNMQNCKSWLTPYDTFYGPSVMQIFGEEELLSVQFKYLVFFIAGCPLVAFLLCLLLSIILHYEQAVWTHCEVTNWLPSLSAAVSSFAPERYIWRLFIGFHGTPRLVLAFAFKNFLITSSLWPSPFRSWYRWASQFSCALNLCEILSLVLLSSISSTEDHFLHALSFCGFALFAHFYMFISIWLFDFSGRRRSSKLGELSFQYKVLCCVGSVLSLVFALYFYYRHNRYCESGVYTLFALSEYSLILFNILFHSTLYYDFHSRTLTLNTAALTSAGGYDLLPMYSENKTWRKSDTELRLEKGN
uniref:Ribosomal_L16 domain-containing protein n=1 Tax=Globodera pallida TaxID=36090 RepID=A0A183BT10_GLOPA